ncbi:PRC-barrel domain-containing protein [Candidatus Pacearchaeota archaeon]|nr:PRC-barrel domain-containing protein [Candidatus Pacearchaeota archaeon]
MLKIKKISEVMNKHVYTAEGEYFGQVDDVNLMDNKVDGWKIRVSGGFTSTLGGARGVIIPHQFVKAIGDVFVVTGGSLPSKSDGVDMPSSTSSSSNAPSSSGSSSGSSMMTSGFDSF